MKRYIFIYFLSLSLFLQSCMDRTSIEDRLTRAESFMSDNPEQSLDILKSVCRDSLSTRRIRARYALLYSMALDKNCIDIASDSIIAPAVKYYRHHGTADDKLKANYYLGRVFSNAGNYQEAIKAYTMALDNSAESSDYYAIELVNSAISDICSINNNFDSALEYSRRAYRYAELAGDSLGVWILNGRVAATYADTRDYHTADSLYSIFLAQPIKDTVEYCDNLMNYARTLVLRENPDEKKYIDIFDRVSEDFDYRFDAYDLCVYAYCKEISGEHEYADSLMEHVTASTGASDIVDIWNYRIQKHRKNYGVALNLFENTIMRQDSIVLATLRQSLTASQKDYYSEKSKRLEQENKKIEYMYIALSLLLIIILLSVMFFFYRSKAILSGRMDEMANIQELIRIRLVEKEQEITSVNRKLEDESHELKDLRMEYYEMFKGQYKILDELCAAYFSPSKKNLKDRIYDEVKRNLSLVIDDEKNQTEFEDKINLCLDGIMTRLRKDLPGYRETDYRFITFLIAGFSPKTIACIMGYTVGTVYVKKNRLKEDIKELDSPDKDTYLKYLG